MPNSFLLKKSNLFSQKLETIPAVLLPDGVSVVLEAYLLTGTRLNKIAREDLFLYEMSRLN